MLEHKSGYRILVVRSSYLISKTEANRGNSYRSESIFRSRIQAARQIVIVKINNVSAYLGFLSAPGNNKYQNRTCYLQINKYLTLNYSMLILTKA